MGGPSCVDAPVLAIELPNRPACHDVRRGVSRRHRWASFESAAVKNVIFDVGAVLLEWNPGRILHGYCTDQAGRAAMQQAIFRQADWLELDPGTLSESALPARIEGRAGRRMPELANLFELVRDSLQLKTNIVALLDSLAARRVPF
jgi:hypothetical protein